MTAAAASGEPEMFSAARTTSLPLSRKFDTAEYRGTAATIETGVRWRRVSKPTRRDICAECAWVQHETGGDLYPRKTPANRRLYGTTDLMLCALHTEAWKERDAATRGA